MRPFQAIFRYRQQPLPSIAQTYPIEMNSVYIVSVVRDFAMYEKCVAKNSCVDGCKIVAIDNRTKNRGVPLCYNEFLNTLDVGCESWIVFCHEDFQFLEPLRAQLSSCDKSYIWGVTGSHTRKLLPVIVGYWKSENVGKIKQSLKDGSGLHEEGVCVTNPVQVETIDCQCIMVHSSLIARYNLRFDEQLTFDLYAEDFCINAIERHGVKSMVIPIKCRHWSGGVLGERYFTAEKYLDAKYPKSCYAAPAHYSVGGGGPILRRIQIMFDRSGTTAKIANSLRKVMRLLHK